VGAQVSGYRKGVTARDRRAARLGYVPRPVVMPRTDAGSVQSLRCLLRSKAHAALLRRIRG